MSEIIVKTNTTAEIAKAIGKFGEVWMDTDKKTLVVNDGVTVGGFTVPDFKVGNFTRDVSIADGNVSYTGVGFKPRVIIFVAENIGYGMSVGFDSITDLGCGLLGAGAGNSIYPDRSIYGNITNHAESGLVLSFDEDGFTIAWTKLNSPTGTLKVLYMAMR